jgi:hypothetical protein
MRGALFLLMWCCLGAEQFTPQAIGYKDLQGERKRLFDQLAAESGEGKNPLEFFLALELTDRTTFDAVTHALSRQYLTAADRRRLGTAIELVERVERVVGARKGERGDQQFRIYCQLKPGATALLGESREFFRDKDNTVFHRGYPICFRSGGRVPSIQFSISRDGRRADIDVDYRSSRLPKSLFNGHLRASNSDVTAGRNFRSHTRKWSGLVAWWRALLGQSPAVEQPGGQVVAAAVAISPNRPALDADAALEEVAIEFLSDWLIRRNLREAMEVVSAEVSSCGNSDSDVENETLAGVPARRLFEGILRQGLRTDRRVSKLSDVIEAINPWDEEYRLRTHAYESLFSLSAISEQEAEEFLCRRLTVLGQEEAVEEADGKRYLMILQFHQSSGVLSLLWQQTPQGWRITAFDQEEI